MAKFSDIIGRYIYLELDGVEYRVYIEEAGKGIPRVCQHTAGSDGRQYRHLLEDRDITSRFHVVAADLPYHGKSLPPTSVRHWEQEYKLTKGWFMRYWVKLCYELELNGPYTWGARWAVISRLTWRSTIRMNSAPVSGWRPRCGAAIPIVW